VALIITFALVTLFLFGLFWGGTLVAQGYFYQNPADRLPLRAAVAALLVGSFTIFWVWLDRKNPGKYDTFFSFAGETTRDFNDFEAARWHYDAAAKGMKKDPQGNPLETIAKFKKTPGGKTPTFVEEGTNKKFATHDTEMMTAALIVKGDDGNPIRFNAEMKKDARTGAMNYISDQNERRFIEEKGSRYIKAGQPGVMYIPSTGVVAVALLVNFLLFLVWFIALWPVLRFSWGHALGFAAVGGLVMMLIVMPLLFNKNRASSPGSAARLPPEPPPGRHMPPASSPA
jgi:hypothetical protein